MLENNYSEDNIISLDWREHIRLRPGMYIGKLGDGSTPDDGIYILIKEVIDNTIDEFVMGFGKQVVIKMDEHSMEIRDFGRGIPLGKVIECVSQINTGGKYDSKAFRKSVGLNGVGTKAVNALSSTFKVISNRDGKQKKAAFNKGILVEESSLLDTGESNGTWVYFEPDTEILEIFASERNLLRINSGIMPI